MKEKECASSGSPEGRLTISKWPAADRPRERMEDQGAAALSDSELIALLIGSGTRGATAVDLAQKLLVRFGGLPALAVAEFPELIRTRGIGAASSARLLAAFEMGRRVAAGSGTDPVIISAPRDVLAVYGPSLAALKTEVFQILLMNNGNQVIRRETLTKGTLNASIIHPREVFKSAVDYRSAGVILIHNHPSGNIRPSPEDRRVTRQLIKAGEIMGIPIIDHIIVAGNSYYSFAEEGGLNS